MIPQPTRRTILALAMAPRGCAQNERKPMGRDILDLAPAPYDARIAYGGGEFQFGELRLPTGRGPHPVAVVIHGGFWRAAYDLQHLGHLCAALAKAGVAAWSLEYRRLGNPGGGWPGTFDDICAGAAHVDKLAKDWALDPKRAAAIGHSAGGHLALWLAKQRPSLRGVVALAAVADLRRAYELRLSRNAVEEFLGGPPERVPDRYKAASPIEMLPIGVKQRLVHGVADDVVPVEISRAYVTRAKAAGDDAELIEVKGGHFELIDPRSRQWPAVEAALFALVQ